MFANEKPVNFKTAEETPASQYSKAKDIWDDRVGSAAVRARNWRIAAFIALLIAFTALGGLIYIASQSKIVPYIVQVDNQSGAVISVAPVEKRHDPNQREIEYFLWNVTKKARSIPKDLVVYKQNWEELYTYLDSATSNKMNNMAVREDYQNKIKNRYTTLLKLKGFNKYSGQDNTYQVRWEETMYDGVGKVMNTYSMEAFYTIDIVDVKPENIHLNPLGIEIKDFSISSER